MYRLPDVIMLGPFPVNTELLLLLLGAGVLLWLVPRRAKAAGFDPALAGDVASNAVIAAFGGAKGLDVLLNPLSHLNSPGLLIVVPRGWVAVLGALLGIGATLWWYRRRHGVALVALADLSAASALAGLAVAAAGRPVPHATVMALLLGLAALTAHLSLRLAAFAGQGALAAVVLGSFALVMADQFGPPGQMLLGMPVTQALSALVGTVAYAVSRHLERRMGEQ